MGTSLNYKVGTMIEIPRAALIADEVCLLKQLINDSHKELRLRMILLN